ncbi:MAG: hydrogenase maturation protease [Gammaproteobacteria bacterium]|nr:MAG: hydrogenase maturation protease [Gammaproteobacteria bacterium]
MIRVIGLGSPWGDDQTGWLVARALRGLFDDQLVEVSVLDRPGPALLEHWRKEDSVLLLDAVRGAGEEGSLYYLEGDGIARLADAALSSHNLGVAECVALARSLDAMPERLCLLGLEIGPIRPEDTTFMVERYLPQWTEAACAKITAWLRDPRPRSAALETAAIWND